MKTILKLTALAVFCLLAAGCTHKDMDDASGRAVRFSARTRTSAFTRTAYSGDIDDATSIERIDWENGDRIMVISDVAATASGVHSVAYGLTLLSGGGRFSYASARPDQSDGRGLLWGEGTNTFFAAYPEPSVTYPDPEDPSVPVHPVKEFTLAGGGAELEVEMPANQSWTSARTGKTESYYANMNLAFMAAASRGTQSDGEVTLSFTPIVTTFYVDVVNSTGAPMTLRRVSLSSGANPLTGTYKARLTNVTGLNDDHDRNYTIAYSYLSGGNYASSLSRTDANSIIYADFDGTSIPVGGHVTVTLFAIPQDNITQLTLSVESDETGTVSLPLREASGEVPGSYVTFTREHKHNLSNVGVPTVSYAIAVTDASMTDAIAKITYDKSGVAGTAQTFNVTSTKTIGGVTYAAPWKAQVKIGDGWVDMDASNRPAWLAGYPFSSDDVGGIAASGTDAGRAEISRNVAPQQVISHVDRLKAGKIWTDNTHTAEVDNSTAANAVDLSYYNFVTREMETQQYTANTYVISKPGWYKFPCVYGNAIENGTAAGDSYRGRLFLANHLDRFKKMNDFSIYTRGPWLENHGLVNYHRFTELVWQKWTVWDGSAGQAVTSGKNPRRSVSFGPEPDVQVIRNIGYANDAYNASEAYVVFYVDPDNIRPGNALIATKEDSFLADDKITWTWQIWITDEDLTPVNISNGSRNYNILPVNLGWVDDSEGQYFPRVADDIRFVNVADGVERCFTGALTVEQPELKEVSTSGWQTYYQWGRKDPFTENATVSVSGDHLLYQSILNPDTAFHEESTEDGIHYIDWTSANYNNLWDSKCTTYGTPGGSLPNHKTVYDPSPRRYCVPPDYAFDGFSSGAYGHDGGFSGGYFFYTGDPQAQGTSTVFFPASGRMDYESPSCALAEKGSRGYFWTYHATTNTQTRVSYALRFTGGNTPSVEPVFSNMTHRANGYSVRPVVYDETQVAPAADGSSAASIDFRQQTWSSPDDLRYVTKTINDNPLIEVTFGKSNNLGTNLPRYDASVAAVVLDSNNSMTITSAAGHPIIQMELIFADDNPESHSLSVSSTSSGTSGAALGQYDYSSDAKLGEWSSRTASCNYNATPPAWSGGETAVTFETNTRTGNGLYLVGITVYYY